MKTKIRQGSYEEKNNFSGDDEWAMRNLLTIHLSGSYNFIEASNGSEALSNLTNDIDLVLLDIMMPDMNGWDVCKKIRSHSPIPILMLTVRGDITDKAQSFESGADDYLVKSFNIEELRMRINALIRSDGGHSYQEYSRET